MANGRYCDGQARLTHSPRLQFFDMDSLHTMFLFTPDKHIAATEQMLREHMHSRCANGNDRTRLPRLLLPSAT